MRQTTAQQVKAFGAKVKRNKFNGRYIKGNFTYIGINFTINFSSGACETEYWEVELFEEDTDERIKRRLIQDNTFERKKDVVYVLLSLDKDLSDGIDIND